MKTKEEIEEKASEYVDSIRNRIDSYAYLDVQEAFAEGAKWMQEQVNGLSTGDGQLTQPAVSGSACSECGGELIHKKEYDVHPYGDNIEYDECAKCGRKFCLKCF